MGDGGFDQIVIAAAERQPTVLRVIAAAERRLRLSMFRCDAPDVMRALERAAQRGVSVEVLITQRARKWKRRLTVLRKQLETIGATVHLYGDPVVKYHAKYILADEAAALVGSMNLTRRCFSKTCDFLLETRDPAIVARLDALFEADRAAPGEAARPQLDDADRVIVGPDRARDRFAALLQRAERRIRLIDHKLKDPAMIALLRARQEQGIDVEVRGRGALGDLKPHGKLLIIDDVEAVVGSIALSSKSLAFRREVAVAIREPRLVAGLAEFFDTLPARGAGVPAVLAATK